jgi:hypothetical protein
VGVAAAPDVGARCANAPASDKSSARETTASGRSMANKLIEAPLRTGTIHNHNIRLKKSARNKNEAR